MTKSKLKFDVQNIDCFAYYITTAGKPACHALNDVYCLIGDGHCSYRKTPGEAAEAKRKAHERLIGLGLDGDA